MPTPVGNSSSSAHDRTMTIAGTTRVVAAIALASVRASA